MTQQSVTTGVCVGNLVTCPDFSEHLRVESLQSKGEPKAMLRPVSGGQMFVAPISKLALVSA